MPRNIVKLVVFAGAVALASCTTPEPEPEPEPEIVLLPDPGPPARPQPPNSAVLDMYIPPMDPETDERETPNTGLNDDEAIWNFRSAMKVATRQCQSGPYATILGFSNEYERNNHDLFGLVNRRLDRQYAAQYPGTNARRVRDERSTMLYNYFAFVPVSTKFCDLMVQRAPQAAGLSGDDMVPFSRATLKEIDDIFLEFYDLYEDYLRRLAEWEALYGRDVDAYVGERPGMN